MDQDDSFLFFDVSPAWFTADLVTIREAACILGCVDPGRFERNAILPNDAEAMLKAIQRAVIAGTLPYFAAWAWHEGSFDAEPVDTVNVHTHLADTTIIRVADLQAWCESKRIANPFRESDNKDVSASTHDLHRYPAELRAAIDAYEAVSRDPSATKRNSPKGALRAWLDANRSDLSENARERIATVANWQPGGGAPKTPG